MKRLLLALFLLPIVSFSQNYELDDIIGAPYCSQLIASPDGSTIAWQVDDKGTRSIYLAYSPEFEPQKVFESNGDDGQVIGSMKIDHAAKNLYFVHGSAPNRKGEQANPASFVQYPKRTLKQINLSSLQISDLGAYPSYILSPKDDFLLLPQGNRLLKMKLSDKKVETLIQMRGSFQGVQLHPDNQSIVFASNRGDHGYIGMYRFGENRIQWLSPGVDRDFAPQWSPDGKQVAFIRVPGLKKGELLNITGGNTFEIWVHDLVSGEGKAVWKSPADDGGFAQYYHSNPLNWSKSDKLWFYSEHEDFMNIYVMNPDGSGMHSVIDGEFEVEHSSVGLGGTVMVFSTNLDDIDRRDIYEHDFGSGKTRQLTDGNFLETEPLVLEKDHIVFREGGFDFPVRIAHMKKGKKQVIFPKTLAQTFPQNQHVVPEQVIFYVEDGTEVHGQLFVKDKSGNKPGVLFMHGGPIRQMLLGYHYSSYYANAYAFNQYMAQQGYAVISVNFRAGIGYGKNFRRAENQGPRGASEYQDIVAAAKYLQNLPYVDSEKIGLWGGSYGGYLTAMGLALNSDIFKAGVDLHGVHDWAWRATDFSPGGAWGIDESLMKQAYESSPASDISKWISPVLFIHGDDDRNVMYGQTVDLVQKLREKGVEHEILVFPDEVHGFYRFDSWLRTFKATSAFFDKHLNK